MTRSPRRVALAIVALPLALLLLVQSPAGAAKGKPAGKGTTTTTAKPTTTTTAAPTTTTAAPTTTTTTAAPTTTTTAAPTTTTTSTTVATPVLPSLRVGMTHTQYSVDGTGAPAAAAEALLASTPGVLQNQHIMGWGARNPEPSPGVYDWRDLDKRVGLMRRTGGTPVITLCCSPDWMKGGADGTTNWTYLAVAPKVEHFDDFAELARQVALRYPDVLHYQVWNEMKGFWDSSKNRWRYEDYTVLYNKVYTALKSVNPNIKVGGPYVHVQSWAPGANYYASTVSGPWGVIDRRDLDVITYWLANKVGADFITIDGGVKAKTSSSTSALLVPEVEATAKLEAVTSWIRERTDLPIWWAELYAVPYGNPSLLSAVEQDVALTAAIGHLRAGGASAALFWEPESKQGSTMPGLWSSTFDLGGGLPSLFHGTLLPYLLPPVVR